MRKFIAAGLAAVAAAAVVTVATTASADDPAPAPAAAATTPGGSNYNWFDLDGCDREPFGVIDNFDKARDVIPKQLGDMRAAGQNVLRFGIFHRHGPDSGTLMDSTGGRLSEENTQNFKDFLAAVKQAGFGEISMAMHVNGDNSPNGWTAWNEELYQENLQLIRYLRPILAEAGMHYRIDLGAELTPDVNQPLTLDYSKRLWADYTAEFGKEDTVGFSIIGSRQTRIANIPAIYGNNPPHLFDFHFYGSQETGNERDQFVRAQRQMTDLGYQQGWVVSEAYYNDPVAAEGIRAGINETGQEVYWLTQWPLTVGRPCGDHVDITPPTAFDNYQRQGF